MRAFGMRIHAITRCGASAEPTDWIATTARLGEMLRAADVFVVCAALTTETAGLIGARELALMQDDAIFINVARGEIVDEAALHAHLAAHPRFFPLQWATAQNNLGAALLEIGTRESGERGTSRLEEAIAAFRAVLSERTREQMPHDWAETQHNLGVALLKLAERQGATTTLQHAVAAFDAALSVFIADGATHKIDVTRRNREIAAALFAARPRA